MRKTILGLALAVCAAPAFAAGKLSVSYPYEGQKLPEISKMFIFGQAPDGKGRLTINGTRVKLFKTGTFIAYLPVSTGTFVFSLDYSGRTSASLKRTVSVASHPPFILPAGQIGIDVDSLAPQDDARLRAGDWLPVSMRGTPGAQVTVSVNGIKGETPLRETYAGHYEGSLEIPDGVQLSGEKLLFRLRKNGGVASAYSDATLSVTGKSEIVRINADGTGLRTGANGAGYRMFLQEGQLAVADARMNGRVRLRLSPSESGWVDAARADSASGYAAPSAEMGNIETIARPDGTLATVLLSQNVPYEATSSENGLDVKFYYCHNHTNWIVYSSSDTFVHDVRWSQPDEQTCVVRIRLNPGMKLWGYDISYDGGTAGITLRRPPLPEKGRRPLAGIKIVLDPGHSTKNGYPTDGAIGPSGLTEAASNLTIAKDVGYAFEKLGAQVIFTRKGDENVPLKSRPKIAAAAGGDLFISIHSNAIADGADPYARARGFQIYYYHPASLGLARSVAAAYRRRLPLPDEGMRYGDYLVARMTQMPAILVENAYLILPEHEYLLASAAYREKIAYALSEGVLRFFGYDAGKYLRNFSITRRKTRTAKSADAAVQGDETETSAAAKGAVKSRAKKSAKAVRTEAKPAEESAAVKPAAEKNEAAAPRAARAKKAVKTARPETKTAGEK